jgi:hypothetical protein
LPVDHDRFARIRPYLYHLTACDNLARIRRTAILESAEALMQAAGQGVYSATRRRGMHQITINGDIVHIRDQAPLHRGNIDFQDGWSFEDVIRSLNARVFFWPGWAPGPIAYGLRHFERYRDENPVILRAPTVDLIQRNAPSAPEFCKYNSGSPRCTGGRGSPRGLHTFAVAEHFRHGPADVVEVTYRNRCALPAKTQYGSSPNGAWRFLFAGAE